MTISIQVPSHNVFVVIFFKTKDNKTITRFGFCDILNNQGLGNCYQPRPSVRLVTLTTTYIIPDIKNTSSNNCLKSANTRDRGRVCLFWTTENEENFSLKRL